MIGTWRNRAGWVALTRIRPATTMSLMTLEAVSSHETFNARLIEVAMSLDDHEWQARSACAGWRVQDVIAHMAVGARSLFDPIPLPNSHVEPPTNRERQHDMHVELRHDWSPAQVLEEFETYGAKRLERLRELQEEPAASSEIALGELGTYPKHTLANAYAFDYFCHLYHDICGPLGSVERVLPDVSHEEIYPVVQWMIWGLPQMQGPELDASLFAPLTLELTGPGASTWTISRPDPSGGLVVEESSGGDVVVTSSATDFVSWGTARTPWYGACTVEGDPMAATAFLSTLNIV